MKITHPLVCLDIEATGIWIEKDKIIEVALIKYQPEGSQETLHTRINPGMLIPKVVSELTGIRNEDVTSAPTFKSVARKVLDFIGDSDLGGFNLERFDLPMLEREMAEAGIKFEWKERRIYDAQKVFHLNEKRDLSAAYQFYCGEILKGAHSALVDTEAVYAILKSQVKKYGEGAEELSVLEKFEYESLFDFYDDERKFCWWNGKLYPMFGKYSRKMALEDIVKTDPGYLRWVLVKDFSDGVKVVVRAALNGEVFRPA